jgi:CubicO group peptidase (beta-lactamase class C family)
MSGQPGTPSPLETAEEELAQLNAERVTRFLQRVRREVDEGLLPAAQVAVARNGRLALFKSFGEARPDSLFCIFSATKAVTSAAAWLLIQEGRLDPAERVGGIIPEFASNGKDVVTVEQLFTHTAGFPHAPFRPLDWRDRETRLGRFAQWRLTWEPGTRYEYHPTATMWVIAEIIERRSGRPFQDFVRERVALPLGLPELFVGLPEVENSRALPCVHVGTALTSEDYARLGLPEPPVTEVTEEAISNFNRPEIRAIGVPGGGGFTNAATLALFYQGLLHGGLGDERVWTPETLGSARRVRTGALRDPVHGKPASRGLGIVIAGDETRNYRGFGRTNSPEAFGHNGAGGQLAWVDPLSGISLAYLTNGHDRNVIREGRRGVAISSHAASLLDPAEA